MPATTNATVQDVTVPSHVIVDDLGFSATSRDETARRDDSVAPTTVIGILF